MTMMGRETPELPADILVSDIEIMALEDFASDRKLPAPRNLGLAMLTMAMLGGYLNCKNDAWPGHDKTREGYTRLAVAAQTYERLIRMDRTSNLYPRLRSDKACGQKAARGGLTNRQAKPDTSSTPGSPGAVTCTSWP